jgi:hypothetical protein
VDVGVGENEEKEKWYQWSSGGSILGKKQMTAGINPATRCDAC